MMMLIRFLANICILSKKRGCLIIRIGAVVNRKLRYNKMFAIFPPIGRY